MTQHSGSAPRHTELYKLMAVRTMKPTSDQLSIYILQDRHLPNLENHLMGALAVGKAEASIEVGLHHLGLLDESEKGRVNQLLVGLALGGERGRLEVNEGTRTIS